jgi:hypothetical protein
MKKTTVQLIDDLDGSVIEAGAGRSLTFGIDGDLFGIDLSEANELRMRQALEPYIKVARKVRAGKRSTNANSSDLQAIRDWARANSIRVSDRGRISAAVREAYAASN